MSGNNIAVINELFHSLFPICRSITGHGNDETLNAVSKFIRNFEIKGVPSGTQMFDWTVPSEWNVKEAYVKNRYGKKIIDFSSNNLHLVSYSTPFNGEVNTEQLLKHLHTLPERPDWIPYRTNYYREDWGFCCKHKLLESNKKSES